MSSAWTNTPLCLEFSSDSANITLQSVEILKLVCLLNEDKSLLRFIWRGMQLDQEPSVYEWQVLPFGTTCSPYCAIYVVHRHVQDHCEGNVEVLQSVQQCFYVDICLQSFPSPHKAKSLIDKIQPLLANGGFYIRQWASNDPAVIHHLPPEAKSKARRWRPQRADIRSACGLNSR